MEARLYGSELGNDANFILASPFGKPLDSSDFGKGMPRLTKKAGLGHWSIHELRHSCASLIISMNVLLEAVSDQLGHASIGVTKGVYVHLLPGSRVRASQAMEDLIFDESELPSDVEGEIVARPVARLSRATNKKMAVIRTSVGRLGLDPSTLRLKVSCSSR